MKKELFWREMVNGQPGSGLSVRAWCRRQALTEPAFYWWRRRLAGQAARSTAANRAVENSAVFVPLRVAADAIAAGVAATDAQAAGAGRIEIVLADRRRVRLIGAVDRQALGDVLAVLTNDSCAAEARACCDRGEAGGNGGIAGVARC